LPTTIAHRRYYAAGMMSSIVDASLMVTRTRLHLGVNLAVSPVPTLECGQY
jgi:hypothetical protein